MLLCFFRALSRQAHQVDFVSDKAFVTFEELIGGNYFKGIVFRCCGYTKHIVAVAELVYLEKPDVALLVFNPAIRRCR